MRKLSELQGNSEKEFDELKNKINEQMKYFNKTKTLKTEQTNSRAKDLNEMKNALESTGGRDHIGKRISELKDINKEMFQVEEERELRFFF